MTESDDDEVSVVSAPAVSSELLAAAPSAAARDARWSQTRWCVSKETEFAVDSTESTDEVLGRETGQGDASASSTTTMAYDASLYATTKKNCHFPPTEAPPRFSREHSSSWRPPSTPSSTASSTPLRANRQAVAPTPRRREAERLRQSFGSTDEEVWATAEAATEAVTRIQARLRGRKSRAMMGSMIGSKVDEVGESSAAPCKRHESTPDQHEAPLARPAAESTTTRGTLKTTGAAKSARPRALFKLPFARRRRTPPTADDTSEQEVAASARAQPLTHLKRPAGAASATPKSAAWGALRFPNPRMSDTAGKRQTAKWCALAADSKLTDANDVTALVRCTSEDIRAVWLARLA